MPAKSRVKVGFRNNNIIVLMKMPGDETHVSKQNWLCFCRGCKGFKVLNGRHIGKRRTKSCGCGKHSISRSALRCSIKVGSQFNEWTFLSGIRGNFAEVKCSCGTITQHLWRSIAVGKSKSCGCKRVENFRKTRRNDMSDLYNSPEYKSWQHMKERCFNKKYAKYKNWGGRGITVCDGLMEFRAFYAHMGSKPEPKRDYSIHRVDNDKNYSCGHCDCCKQNGWSNNVKWADAYEQQNATSQNVFLTYNGKTQTVKQWSREVSAKYTTILKRRRYGWPVKECLFGKGK